MKIAIGPLLYGWPEAKIRDASLSLAAETDVDLIYLGEVVCSKRTISGTEWLLNLAEELRQSGKEIVLSTLAMPTTESELQALRDICQAAAEAGLRIEANDMAAVSIASALGVGFVAGPHLNCYNHGVLLELASYGAQRVVTPLELPAHQIPALLGDHEIEVEYFSHGRLPLTFSARCYSARAWGLSKSECRHICFRHPEGMEMNTLDEQEFSMINGIQIMSRRPFTVIDHLSDLSGFGVNILRLSPQPGKMTDIIHQFHMVLEAETAVDEALQVLSGNRKACDVFCNGYYHGHQGRLWIEAH